MAQKLLYPSWKDFVVFSAGSPKPQILMETDSLKVVLVGLEGGNKIPVRAGATVVVPDGAKRGVEAETKLAFLGVQARKS